MEERTSELDRQMEELRNLLEADEEAATSCNQRLDTSWIYHDNALEGIVLSYAELNSALDDAIISDSTLIPQYDDVRNHKTAIAYIRAAAARRKPPIGLDFIKRLHTILGDEPPVRGNRTPTTAGQYRKDTPLHRLYFHEISPPEKISYQMRKLGQWLASVEAKRLHPIKRASAAHHRVLAIYPWSRHSGKVARLLMNAMLLRDGYIPAVIHAVERQRYYEVLRQPPGALVELVTESLVRTVTSALRFFDGDQLRAAS